jgi:hypothetical protein
MAIASALTAFDNRVTSHFRDGTPLGG